MSLSHYSRSNRRHGAGRRSWEGAGSLAVALGHWVLVGPATAGIALGRQVRDGVLRWQQRRKAIQELSRLDDRMLRDIGVRRADIPFVVEVVLNEPSPFKRGAAAGRARVESHPAAPAPVGCG